MLCSDSCYVNTKIALCYTIGFCLFRVVPFVSEDGIDDVKKKMTAPQEDNQINEEITNNEPSACDALV